MAIDIKDLVAAVGVAPKVGQVPTLPTGTAGWSKPPVKDSPDLRRIIALPRRKQPTEDEQQQLVEIMTARYRRDRTGLGKCRCKVIRPEEDECITSLRATQAWALLELETTGGLLGSIGVGHGKTLLDILAPLAMPNCKTALLLVKPTLVPQLITEYELISQHFNVPSLIVHAKADYSKIVNGAPVLHVMPFSRISRKTAATFITRLDPDFILIDEVQRIKDVNTATAARVMRPFGMDKHTWAVIQGAPRFAGWTGTLSDKSLNDYGHIAAMCLREGSPLPVDPDTCDDWARAIDPLEFRAPAGALFDLCEPGEEVNSGFHRRLVETRGVVATRKSAIDAHLVISQRKPPPIPNVVKDALASIHAFVRPDGEELVEAWEVVASAKQAACGFYYQWTYPRGEPRQQIDGWFRARKAWNRELRNKLFAREEHLDSQLLCEEAAARAWVTGDVEGLPSWKSETYQEWMKYKGTVRPVTRAVRLDPFLAQDAADWGLSNRGVIWYSYADFGAWIGELSGLPVHTGGPKAADLIAKETGDRSIIASINAHGTGRDGLQRLFSKQLVTNPPSGAEPWEQLLGRLHRLRQRADRVDAVVYRHTQEFRASVDKAIARAMYVQETLGSEQKLLAGYDLEE